MIQLERTERDNMSKEEGENRLIHLSILIGVSPYVDIHLDRIDLDRWIWRHGYLHLARNQIWTGGTRIFSPLLYQLSYPGSSLWIILVQGFNLCQLKRSKKVFLLVFRMIFIIFDLEVTNMIKMDCNWIISKWSNLCRSYITKSIDHMISLLTDQLNWS